MKRSLLGSKPHRARLIDGQTSIVTIRGITATLLLLTSAPLAIAPEVSDTTAKRTEFAATLVNTAAQPKGNPSGMVWIPGGEFSMGAAMTGHGSCEMAMPSNDAEPIHRVRVDGFWIDTSAVTNDEFEKFVNATGYITIAERAPTREEFPTAPEEISSRALSFLSRAITKFRSTIIINGGAI